MQYQLRDYQNECVEKIHEVFQKEYSQLIQLPTGSGKTWIFLNYLKKYSKSGLIICPNRELQNQIFETGKIFLGKEYISKGIPRNKKRFPYYVITAPTLLFDSNTDFLFDQVFETVIVDEAHRATSDTYNNFLCSLDDIYEYNLLGCTATPERLDKKCLMEIFNFISFDMNLVDMIEKGYLCDIEGYRIKTGIKLKQTVYGKSGDYTPTDLKHLDKETRNNILISTYEKECVEKKTLIFCLSVAHAIKIAKLLVEKGYRAEAIHGGTPDGERKRILKDFKEGRIQALTNCQLLTEGFDEPTIEALIIARPTKSKSLYCQMLGRGVRKIPGKEVCYLYELTDNSHNICTFSSAANENLNVDYEYKPGTRLSNLHKEVQTLTPEDILVEKEKFDIFPNNTNIFKSIINALPPTPEQIKTLQKIDENIICTHPSMLDACFLIWKQKKLVEYGLCDEA